MGTVAKKLIASGSVSGPYEAITGQYTKGVGMGSGAVMGYDVTDIDNAVLTDTVTNSNLSYGFDGTTDPTRDLGFLANYSTDGFSCVDFSDVTNVSVLDSVTSSTYYDLTKGCAVDTVGEILYVSGYTPNYLSAIDYSTPTALSRLGSVATTNGGTKIVLDVARDTAFQLAAGARLQSFDIADPTSMTELSILTDSTAMSTASGLAIDTTRDLIFTSNYGNDSVSVLDTTTVSAVTVTSTLVDTVNLDRVQQIAVDEGDELAFCLGNRVLSVVDYSNTASLSVSDTISTAYFSTGYSRSVTVDKVRKLVFVKALNVGGIFVYDYSTPTALVLVKLIYSNAAPLFYLGGIAP